MTLQLVRELIPEELTIPQQARQIGLNRIILEINEIDIQYINKFIQIPICESLTETYDTLKEACKLFGLSFEVTQWIETTISKKLERRFALADSQNNWSHDLYGGKISK